MNNSVINAHIFHIYPYQELNNLQLINVDIIDSEI